MLTSYMEQSQVQVEALEEHTHLPLRALWDGPRGLRQHRQHCQEVPGGGELKCTELRSWMSCIKTPIYNSSYCSITLK